MERDPGAVDTPPAAQSRYRWVVMGVVLIGSFMVVLDTSIVNVALPQIGREFGSLARVEWIVTAYLLAVGVVQPVTGWLSDRFGKRQIFLASLAAFTFGSLLCALAPSLGFLVFFRVVQGFGGGAMMPVGMAMIFELFDPEERGRALGLWGIAVMAAPSAGPVIGGYLTTAVDWRWLFAVNVPIGIAGLIIAPRLLRDTGDRHQRPFDGAGFAFAGIGTALLLLALSEGGSWGWGSPETVVCAGLAALSLGAFWRHNNRTDHPLINPHMFRVPVFNLTMLVVALLTVAQFGRFVFIPLQLETLRGYSALQVGFTLMPSALGIAITMPLGGRLVDRIGARVPVVIGTAVFAAAYWPLAHLSLDTPLWQISGWLFVGGLGAGLGMMPCTVVAMNSVKGALVAQASSMSNLYRQLSGAFGTALLSAVLAAQIDLERVTDPASGIEGFNTVFLVAFGFLLAAFALAFFLPRKSATLAIQRDRRDEMTDGVDSAPMAAEI